MKHPRYNKHRPYRDRIVEIQREYGATKFDSESEFWSLGGPEHFEFIELSKHLDFGVGSYHTVDRGEMADVSQFNGVVVAHGCTEFIDIFGLWRNPLVLSYDSTELLTAGVRKRVGHNAHDQKILDLTRLARAALSVSSHGRLFVHANYMLAYPGTRTVKSHGDFFKDDYFRWASIFMEQLHTFKVEYTDGAIERMDGAHTEMVDFHFIVTKIGG